jgi:hypothetical protein
MSVWYNRIAADTGDLTPLLECLDHYEAELIDAKREVKILGSLEGNAAKLPGVTEYRFNQLQEIEAIYEFLNLKLKKVRAISFKRYFEGYQREMSTKDAQIYADADDEVLKMSMLVNQIKLMRDQYLGIMKGLDIKHWQISNIVKLRMAGLEDADIRY